MISRLVLPFFLVAVAAGCGPTPLEVMQPDGLEFRLVVEAGDPDALPFPRWNAPPDKDWSLHLGPPEPFEVARIHSSYDKFGFPAVGFEIAKADRARFEDFTKSLVGSRLAIVVHGEVVTAPEIDEPLPGSGIITGGAFGFSEEDVRDLIRAMDP